MPVRPVAILAYSNAGRELTEARKEMVLVRALLNDTNLNVQAEQQTTPENLEALWLKYREEVLIFHFGGHAGPSILQMNQDEFTAKMAFSEGLSDFIGKFCPNIKLVFLNGCSTEDQAPYFLRRGVSAVIATEIPVKDSVAKCFAERFYTYFVKNKLSLREAFDTAQISLAREFGSAKITDGKGNVNLNLLNEDETVRGPFLQNQKIPKNTDLYLLKIHPEQSDTGQETFEDWGIRFERSANIPKKDDASQAKMLGVDKNSYLRCDRAQHYSWFERVLRQKIAGTMPSPFFFFVHATEVHCPDDLTERFISIGLPEHCGKKYSKAEIELPGPDDLIDGNPNDLANPTRDLFKIQLSELYNDKFEGEEAHDNLLCRLSHRPGDESALVVVHRFSTEDWNAAYDPVSQATLHQKIETRLRYYIGDFSRYLQEGFSERLIVVFSLQYYEPDDFFPDLFNRLEQEFTTNRVKVLGNLPLVRKTDLGRWQTEVLEEQFFIVNDVFFDRKGAPVAAMPFFDAKQILIPLINKFNEAKAANV